MQSPDTASGPVFTADPAAFLGAISAAGAPVVQRNTIPILSNLHIDAIGNSVTVTGTDMDMDVSATFAATVERKGKTTIPASEVKKFAEAVKGAADVRCEVKERAELSAPLAALGLGFSDDEQLSVTVPVIAPEEFPTLSGFEVAPAATMTLKAVDWITVLDAVTPCISTEETRYYLNGIFLHEFEGKWSAVATDGHRMMLMRTPAKARKGFKVIVPRKTVAVLRQKLGKVPVDTKVAMELHAPEGATRVRWKFEDLVINSKTIDGTFPDYTRVIPAPATDPKSIVEIDTVAWSRMMRTVSRLQLGRSRGAALSFGDHGCHVVSGDDRVETVIRTPLPYPPVERELKIGFNHDYLAAMCAAMGPAARISLIDQSSPTRFDAVVEKGAMQRIGVLMPMRV